MSYYSEINLKICGINVKGVLSTLHDLTILKPERFYNLFSYNGMFEYFDCSYEIKTLRSNAKQVELLLMEECNHFDYLMEHEWLHELKDLSTLFSNVVFTIKQKTEEDEYYEWEFHNGAARKREMIVILKGKEWKEI